MKLLKELRINCYRGIKGLTLEGLKPITLFLGENSVGKSSVLESIFMITGPSNPFIALRTTNLRTHFNYGINDLKYIFNDGIYQNEPSIDASLNDNEERSMHICPNFSISEDSIGDNIASDGNNHNDLTGLDCYYKITRREFVFSGKSSLLRNNKGKIEPICDKEYKEEINSVFLSPYNPIGSLVEEYDQLVKAGKKEVILQAAVGFDNRITAIESTTEGLYVGYSHLVHMVPLKMAGDGIQKYLSIALRAYNPTTNIIIIDEIENGLHFSAHQKLWKCIIEAAKNFGKQFFISTHNQETLRCLSSLVGNSEEISQLLNIITLSKDGDAIEPYYLSGIGLSGAFDNNIEIRK